MNCMLFMLHKLLNINNYFYFYIDQIFFTTQITRTLQHYHFKVYGICHINFGQLYSFTNKAIGYLIIQILFKLNKY